MKHETESIRSTTTGVGHERRVERILEVRRNQARVRIVATPPAVRVTVGGALPIDEVPVVTGGLRHTRQTETSILNIIEEVDGAAVEVVDLDVVDVEGTAD